MLGKEQMPVDLFFWNSDSTRMPAAMHSFYFFISSRRRHTRCGRDWSSDVCSSDLSEAGLAVPQQTPQERERAQRQKTLLEALAAAADRSEERRVGKECRSRWSP